MNLIVNSIEAMKGVDGIRELVIKSRRSQDGQILVSMSDTGIGFPPQLALPGRPSVLIAFRDIDRVRLYCPRLSIPGHTLRWQATSAFNSR
jgi:hypothetical protein